MFVSLTERVCYVQLNGKLAICANVTPLELPVFQVKTTMLASPLGMVRYLLLQVCNGCDFSL